MKQLAFLSNNLSIEVRRKAEKLMSNYRNLEAIIESKKMDLETRMTVNYQASESQRSNGFSSETENVVLGRLEIDEYLQTKKKLSLVYDSLKPKQRTIWDERYVQGRNDVDVYCDMDIPDRTYYRLKREMIAVVADAFGLLN